MFVMLTSLSFIILGGAMLVLNVLVLEGTKRTNERFKAIEKRVAFLEERFPALWQKQQPAAEQPPQYTTLPIGWAALEAYARDHNPRSDQSERAPGGR